MINHRDNNCYQQSSQNNLFFNKFIIKFYFIDKLNFNYLKDIFGSKLSLKGKIRIGIMYNRNKMVHSSPDNVHYIQRMFAPSNFDIALWGSRSNIFPDLARQPFQKDMFSCIPDLRLKDFLKNK